jgi:hypothetical protein
MRVRHVARSTEKVYVSWIRRFILFQRQAASGGRVVYFAIEADFGGTDFAFVGRVMQRPLTHSPYFFDSLVDKTPRSRRFDAGVRTLFHEKSPAPFYHGG